MTEIQSVNNIRLEAFERQRQHYEEKRIIQEHHNKKLEINEMLLKAYYANLERFETYNQQRQIQHAQADQGKFLDIEVK